MLQVTLENISDHKINFRKLLGDEFIDMAEDYSQQITQSTLTEQPKTYSPFFDFWHEYNLDIKRSLNQNQLSISTKTYFILNLLEQLQNISHLDNFSRIVTNLRSKGSFYSAAFETSIASLYINLYSLTITREGLAKSPDFDITLTTDEKMYIECKSLEDFYLGNNKVFNEITHKLEKLCKNNRKSNIVILKTVGKYGQENVDLTVQKIRDIVLNDRFGEYPLNINGMNVVCHNSKLAEWDKITYGGISVKHPSNCTNLLMTLKARKGPSNRIQENSQIILIGIENYPILDFEKRIKNEIKKASKQLPKGKCNILHIQLPISDTLDFENYINKNYMEIQSLLESTTHNINVLIISRTNYNLKNLYDFPYQISLFVNTKAQTDIPKGFKYPLPGIFCLPCDIDEKPISQDIQICNIKYRPVSQWDKTPKGIVLFHMINSKEKVQFRLWKSYDGSIAFEFIVSGIMRHYVKSKDNPFVPGVENKIDIKINTNIITIFVNDKQLNTFIAN